MNKNILFVISVAFVAIVAVGTVSAFDLGFLFGTPQDQNVTIDGESFIIPGTFKENESINDTGASTDYYLFKVSDYEKGYTNGTSHINFFITEYNTTEIGDEIVNYMNGTAKDISGVKGFLYYDDSDYTYTFAKDNKVITIQSDKEDLINSAIV